MALVLVNCNNTNKNTTDNLRIVHYATKISNIIIVLYISEIYLYDIVMLNKHS